MAPRLKTHPSKRFIPGKTAKKPGEGKRRPSIPLTRPGRLGFRSRPRRVRQEEDAGDERADPQDAEHAGQDQVAACRCDRPV